jgi:hypothetical protein
MPVIAGTGVSSSSLRCACDQGLGSVTTVERPQNPGGPLRSDYYGDGEAVVVLQPPVAQ